MQITFKTLSFDDVRYHPFYANVAQKIYNDMLSV